MEGKRVEYFNKQPRIGCMSTSGKDGKVNVACFGSPRMIDDQTVVMRFVGIGRLKTSRRTRVRSS